MDDLGNRMSVEDRSERDILYAADIVNAYESVGAVGWWKMNESSGTTAADGSGNAQDGTLNNFGASPWVAGQTGYGNALEFDGVDDYVSIPSDTEFVFPDEYTYAVWIKPDNVTTSYQPILNRTTSSIWQMGFWLSNSQLRAYTHYSGDDAAATSVSGVITAGQWQHVAVVHKGGKNHLYVNGQEVSYATQTQATGTKTTYPAYGFVMGTGLESVQRYFKGCLDDVLIFNTALSAHAIEALYLDAAGTGEKYYAHDAAGNLIRDDRGYRYSYDYENRLSKVEKPDGAGDWQTVATFEYDALGRRIRKISYDSVPSVATLYYYDPDWRCLEEYQGGTLDRLYVYGNYIDEVVLGGGTAGAYYTLHDHLYSAVALLDTGTGAVLERYEYDAYGTAHVFDGSWNTLTASAYGNPYTFTGRRLDLLDNGDLETMYYRHRYYRPITARFLQRDMLGIGMHGQPTPGMQYLEGLNLYQYVLSAPTAGTDPGGLFKWWDCVACGAALLAKFGGALGGAAAFCPRDNPNISWGECISQVMSEYVSKCTLWEEFKKNPAEWVGAAACISCGVRFIEQITAPNPPPECDDESEPDCPSDSGGRSQKCILDGIDPWLNKCIYACPDGSTVLSGTPPCFPFIIVDDEYRPPTWPF